MAGNPGTDDAVGGGNERLDLTTILLLDLDWIFSSHLDPHSFVSGVILAVEASSGKRQELRPGSRAGNEEWG